MFRVVLAACVLAVLLLLSGCAPGRGVSVQGNGSVYTFGEVTACKTEATIRFSGVVRQDVGWVQHLFALNGYQWLEEKAAIVSLAQLSDLQKAFALLDWQLWDQLWQGIESQAAYAVQVYVHFAGQTLMAQTLLEAPDVLSVGDLIFLGCPYFDAVALSASSALDCSLCPVLPLEQAALGQRFVRENGASGFTLSKHRILPLGSRVEVVIKLP